VTGGVEPVVALVAGVAPQALPGNLLVVERQDVVVGAGRRWPGLSEKRDDRCHGKSDALGPGPPAGCWDASGSIRRLRGGGTVETGARMYLARTNISTASQPERCTLHDSECQTKVNVIFRRLTE